MTDMAVAVKRLDVKIGDLVEIDGRQYDVVSDKKGRGGARAGHHEDGREIHAENGGRSATQAEFDELFGDVPSDDEG